MKISEVKRLYRYWEKFPPVRVLVALAVGFEIPQAESEKKYLTREDIERFVSMSGPTIRMPG